MHTKEDELVHIPLFKRFFDIVVSGLILIIFFPLCLIIILAIKIEGIFIANNRGPIFYKETRISQGMPFKLRKFRIFKTSAYEPILKKGEIVHTKPLEHNPNNITTIGNILKNFYLDESPQLWNVFIGDMSLIGPRPWNVDDYNNEVSRGIYRKKIIKAGLTGPVQIHKLDANKFGGEQKLDNDYIEIIRKKNGLVVVANDIKFLILSIWFMLKGQGL